MEKEIAWHAYSEEEVLRKLHTSKEVGLSLEEVRKRQEKYGFNELEVKKRRGPLLIFLSQFSDFMIGVLIVAAIVSGFVLKETIDALAILAILFLNAVLGFVQEYRAEKALEALQKLTAPQAYVLREGSRIKIPARELVPGDIIFLSAGDLIPADARLTHTISFKTQEAALTGESESETKNAVAKLLPETTLGDRENMVFMGTVATSGKAQAVVAATGTKTEMGKIAEAIEEKEEKTPLQKELKKVGKRLALISLFVCALVFVLGIFTGKSLPLMFLTAVSLAVAAIPEGLPAAITVSLALGVQRMAKKKAIVRKLHAVETLGATTVICSDKTGTITYNKMKVAKLYVDEQVLDLNKNFPKSPSLEILLETASLCNDAYKSQKGELIGDPTEIALLVAAESAGVFKEALEKKYPKVSELPFESERKAMSTIHRKDKNTYLVFTKGAPEEVLKMSSHILEKDREISPLSASRKEKILKEVEELAKKGYRNIAFAYKESEDLPGEINPQTIEKDLTFVGFAALVDPIRDEVYEAISECQRAKIKIVMITGDHKLTAEAIARELNLLDKEKLIITDAELEKMSQEELNQKVEDIAAYARVDPIHKLKIIRAFKDRGHIVAMTGDGINDAPAIKAADIGISMGVTGTDVARETSDLILADDNFATIVSAVREGRLIFDNIKKFIFFLLSCNTSEILTMLFSVLAHLPLPLLPVQILWMNLVTDGLPALALGVDPAEKDLMLRPPRNVKESILSGKNLKNLLLQGVVLASGALFAFLAAFYFFKVPLSSPQKAQTIAFTTLVFAQLFHTLNFRNPKSFLLSKNSLANPSLLAAISGSILLHSGLLYIPLLQKVFKTAALAPSEWALILISSLLPVLLINLIRVTKLRFVSHLPTKD